MESYDHGDIGQNSRPRNPGRTTTSRSSAKGGALGDCPSRSSRPRRSNHEAADHTFDIHALCDTSIRGVTGPSLSTATDTSTSLDGHAARKSSCGPHRARIENDKVKLPRPQRQRQRRHEHHIQGRHLDALGAGSLPIHLTRDTPSAWSVHRLGQVENSTIGMRSSACPEGTAHTACGALRLLVEAHCRLV